MRLISLTANVETFHPVVFNRTGPSFIVGRQKTKVEEGRNSDKTYNGVGKSLMIFLINYCLGSESKAAVEEKLPGWEFYLKVEIGGAEVTITRRTSESDVVQYGFEKLKLKEFRERIQAATFPGIEATKFLSFRMLVAQFLRPGKAAYTQWDGIQFSERPVQRMLRAAYLLGLDTKLAINKFDLIQELDEMREASKRFEKDPIIKEYFHGRKDVNLDIRELVDALSSLKESLSNFKVAENYHDIEEQANELKSELQKHRNLSIIQDNKLRQIEESLKAKTGITLTAVKKAYGEVQFAFSERLLKTLSDVEVFHANLLASRKTRLQKEKKTLEGKLVSTRTTLERLNQDLDSKLKFLGDHGALDELLSLKDRATEIEVQLNKLTTYKDITKKYKDRASEIKLDLASGNLDCDRYLTQNNEAISEATETFRSFAKKLYPNKPSALTIENNDGENQIRYIIDVKILDDASDGINEAKIFAYDVSVASLQRNHAIEFLCHDSRLFSDIDPRQRAALFDIAFQYSTEKGLQYIATVNEDQIEPLKGLMTDEEFDQIFNKCNILDLKDDSPADKLLGIEVDLDYD